MLTPLSPIVCDGAPTQASCCDHDLQCARALVRYRRRRPRECSRRRTVRGDSYLEHFRRITIWQCTDGSGRPATVTSRLTGARAEVLRLPRVAERRVLPCKWLIAVTIANPRPLPGRLRPL